MKCAVVVGTRPEVIKMAPIIQELERRKADYYILHTGQHYDYKMFKTFFGELRLADVKYSLNIDKDNSQGKSVGNMIMGMEEIFASDRPDVVLVQGDTNSVFAGAFIANRMGIKVGHVESGLRSGDRMMPEEINRILVDHCSDFLFVTTQCAKNNLVREGIEKPIIWSGNTIVDALNQYRSKVAVNVGGYFVVTLHRQENVDDIGRLRRIFKGLDVLYSRWGLPIMYPVHPRVRKVIDALGINLGQVTALDPLGYADFIKMVENSKLVVTDSGGVQEEACILGVPCVTVRTSTERPETILIGANILAEPEEICQKAESMVVRTGWGNPYGDGTASRRIVDYLSQVLN